MAYFSQEKKKAIAPKIKDILKKYGLKGSLSIRHHSTVVLNIQRGDIDFITNFNDCAKYRLEHGREAYLAKDYLDVNVYWYKEHFAGRALECLQELIKVLNTGNHNRSDIMTDYFDVGFYVDVNIGQWNKPYIVEGAMA